VRHDGRGDEFNEGFQKVVKDGAIPTSGKEE
jgi:hypothetical protein